MKKINDNHDEPLSAVELAECRQEQDATDLLAVKLRILLRKGNTLAVASKPDDAPTVFRLEHMREYGDIPVIEFDNGEYRYLTGAYPASGGGLDFGLSARDLELIQAVATGSTFVSPGSLEVSFAATPRGKRLALRRTTYAARKAA